jgi:branched-chain amino acid transport system ATP-binding protein
MLAVEGVCTGYGRALVLHEVTLRVGEGEVVALVGSNGAGKTTLLNTIAGLHRGGRGSGLKGKVTLDGVDVTGMPAPRLIRRGLVLVPERRQIWPGLSVADHLLLGAFHRRRDRAFVAERTGLCTDLFPVLAQRLSQQAGTLSGGEQQMLAIARALMAGPRLLLLDEPSLGLAPLVVRRIFEVVGELRRAGLTVLVVEQVVAAALGAADRGYVLERGRAVLDGDAADLLADPAVRAAYLGIKADTTGIDRRAATTTGRGG